MSKANDLLNPVYTIAGQRAEIERLEKRNAEMLEVMIKTARDIFPPLHYYNSDMPLRTTTGNYRRLEREIARFKEAK